MAHIIVIGAGIVGLSVARAMQSRGHEVTLLEQGPIPNPDAASFDAHRMIRYPYGKAAGYTRMVTDAFAAWDRLWTDLGAVHFESTGSIVISLAAGDYAAQSRDTLQALGIAHEIVDRTATEKLCPHLSLPDGAWGLVSHPGGPLFADRIVTDVAKWLTARGVRMETGCRVERVDENAGTATLSDGRTVSGDLLVIAAGAWLSQLMPKYATDDTVFRQALLYVDPPDAYRQSWRDAPSIAAIGDHSGYTLPDLKGAGLKFGFGGHRRKALPNVDGFSFDFEREPGQILAAFQPYLKMADSYRPLRMKVGYYVLDPSRQFKVSRSGKAVVVTNCDGQMFKFGPLIGERIAAMFAGQETIDSLAHWAAGR